MGEHVYLRKRNEEIKRLRFDEGWKISAISIKIGYSESCISKVLSKMFHGKQIGNIRKVLETKKPC